MIQLLEDTHPELADFMQKICRCYKHNRLINIPSHKVVKISGGKFYGAWGDIKKASQVPGRNTPCPCGSGKKYKRCCGR